MFGGVPFLGRIGSAAIYPLHLPLLWFDAARALQLSIALHLLLLALGFWVLARFGWRLTSASATLIPLVVLGSAFVAIRSMAVDQIIPLTLTPWILFFLERTLTSNTFRYTIGLGGSVALLILGGHPQYIYQLALVLTLIAVARIIDLGALKSLGKVIAGVGLGVGMSSLPLVATWALTKTSAVSGSRSLNLLSNPTYVVAPSQLNLGILGAPFNQFPALITSSGESLAGLGFVCCALALTAVVLYERRLRLTTFALLGAFVVSAIFAVGPRWLPFRIAYHLLPGFGGARVPGRWMMQVVVAGALLAGIGLDAVIARQHRFGRRLVTALVLLGGTLLLALSAPTSLVDLNVGWWLIAALGLATCVVSHAARFGRLLVVLVLLGFASIEFIAAGRNTPVKASARSASFADYESDFTRYLTGKQGRVLSLTFDNWADEEYLVTNLRPNTNVQYGIKSIDGYDGGMWIQKRWARTMSTLTKARFNIDLTVRSQVKGPLSSSLLARLGVRYVLTDTSVVPASAQLSGFGKPVLKRGAIELLENPDWIGEAFGYRSTRQVSTTEGIRQTVLTAAGSGADVAITEAGSPTVDCVVSDCSRLPVRIDSRPDGSFVALANADQPTVLVISQSWFPDWKVSVNGKRARTFPVDGLLLGVEIPPGPVRVVGAFEPEWVEPAVIVSLLSLLFAAGLSLNGFRVHLVRRRGNIA